jgi:hypothetical protein
MGKIASLYAEIGADTTGLKKGLQESKTGLSGIADQFKSLTGISLTTAGAIGALAAGLKFSIDQAAEAELVNAKLGAVLQATGGVSGMTADSLDTLSRTMSRMSGVDDETIKSSEAVLLTFRNIGQSVFPDATQAALDMSAVMGGDLQSSIVQIGKALNDPIKGFSALQRVGVTFSDSQRSMITNLQDSGDLLGAQGVILQELQSEFGGAAEAMGNTYTGSINKMKNALGDFAEATGKIVLPTLTQTIIQITKFITAHQDASDAGQELSTQMLDTAQSYAEYSSQLDIAARANGNVINSEGDLVHLVRNRQSVTEELITSNYRLTQTEWEHINAQQAMSAAMTAGTQAANTSLSVFGHYTLGIESASTAYQNLIQAQADLNAGLQSFYQDTGNKAAQVLSGLLIPSGERYQNGLETIDDVMGTNLGTMNLYQIALEDAGKQYANTGDMETYRSKLQDIKSEYGDFMTSELQTASTKAQTIYNSIIGLPQLRGVTIRFNATGDPRLINWVLAGESGQGLGPYTTTTNTTIPGAGSQGTGTGIGVRNGVGYASGADFNVPVGFSNDSFGPMWAQSGEHVSITKPGQGNNDNPMVNNFYVTGYDPIDIADEIMRKLEQQGVNA